LLPGDTSFLKKYFKPDLLIIDDMGLKHLRRMSGEYLFEIIMRRYENRSTIMTSNRPIEEWGKLVGDVPSASAILDRFLHHADIIAIEGRSYRLKPKMAAKGAKGLRCINHRVIDNGIRAVAMPGRLREPRKASCDRTKADITRCYS
jgi:hypothetical protein